MGIPLYVCSQETILATKGIPMASIVLKVRFSVKEQLLRSLRRCRQARVRLRYLVVLNLANGRSVAETAPATEKTESPELRAGHC